MRAFRKVRKATRKSLTGPRFCVLPKSQTRIVPPLWKPECFGMRFSLQGACAPDFPRGFSQCETYQNTLIVATAKLLFAANCFANLVVRIHMRFEVRLQQTYSMCASQALCVIISARTSVCISGNNFSSVTTYRVNYIRANAIPSLMQ